MGQQSFKPRKITVQGKISQPEALASMMRLLNDYAQPEDLKAALEELPDDVRQKAVMTELMACQIVERLATMVAQVLSGMMQGWGYTVEEMEAVSEELMDDIAEEAKEAEGDSPTIIGL